MWALPSHPLRFITYLAPGIPEAFFAAVVDWVGHRLGVDTSLAVDSSSSGPRLGEPDPFAHRQADVGFLCAPSYLRLDSVDLVPAAPLYADPACEGRPVYFSHLVVARHRSLDGLAALRGARFAFNDLCSLSGLWSAHQALGEPPEAFFAEVRCSGSHFSSIELVARGDVDAAAIDSGVLLFHPELAAAVRVVETWGPFPVQPVVVRRGARDLSLPTALADALLAMPASELAPYPVAGFAPVSEADYEPLRSLVQASL